MGNLCQAPQSDRAADGEAANRQNPLQEGQAEGHSQTCPLTILHFNDVYNIQQRKKEPVGGAARFATKINEIRAEAGEDSTLVFFSGDAFSPSSASVVFKGRQMVPALNSLGLRSVPALTTAPPSAYH